MTRSTPGPYSGIPLESDPAIFTDLLRALGVKGLQFHDLLFLDPLEEVRASLPGPVLAVILIYATTPDYEAGLRKERQDARDAGKGYAGVGAEEPTLWFDQTIRHACGFMGILHAAANLSPAGQDGQYIEPNSLLSNLLRDALSLAPAERAALLKSSLGIAEAYNAASIRGTSQIVHAEEEAIGHYVCFTRSPQNGHIYELDGGKNGPIDQNEWLGGDQDILSAGLKLAQEFIAKRTDPQRPYGHVMVLVPEENA
ncbi:Ubiquitin carboxyl-terminal hydrolase [Mycena chlorophos]|uniref:Ubiquitin carboxyl-terminal hydrolase n=1 Tax=Mycena chlorophos TaxID=658473 RepID=A0A8H6TP85_MYCCL|nr:Ubiquitin carboxyl-terminal hydrolase [Mycena chlorophos]